MGIMGVQHRKEKRHMAKNLIDDLKDGLCLVKFRSLKSGGEREIEATLDPTYIPNHFVMNQRDDSDKILMYNCTFEKWEDIQKDTVIEWTKL